ncbi:alcohol dehydrogenase catalytic domain-containing protein [Teichococcus aestuarii]|uniref:alcohol dehydrogenase catalytic domain-containing protein n=1 Tax=Teichococcus aestuarii TaxID=568898 RepID=UPI003610A86E
MGIRVAAAGICGSDIHAYEWTPGYEFMAPHMPFTLGHEFAGHVTAVGAGVEGFAPGDAVTAWPTIGCGQCRACREGRNQDCRAPHPRPALRWRLRGACGGPRLPLLPPARRGRCRDGRAVRAPQHRRQRGGGGGDQPRRRRAGAGPGADRPRHRLDGAAARRAGAARRLRRHAAARLRAPHGHRPHGRPRQARARPPRCRPASARRWTA